MKIIFMCITVTVEGGTGKNFFFLDISFLFIPEIRRRFLEKVLEKPKYI